jgi:hypothetical protein
VGNAFEASSGAASPPGGSAVARKKTLFIYNDTKKDQEWTIYSEGVINEKVTLGQVRKSFTLSLSGDVTIQFGVEDTVYLKATYTYSDDTWTHHTDTPKEFNFTVAQSAVSVTSSYEKD